MAPKVERDSFYEQPALPVILGRIGNLALSLSQSRRTLVGTLTASCALGLMGIASSAKGERDMAHLAPMELAAVTSDNIFTDSLRDAEAAAQQIHDQGYNAVRITYKVNKGTAWDAYKLRLCNAAQAAAEYQEQLIVSFEGVDDGLGYYPQSKKEIKQFVTTGDSVFWDLASKNGCSPSVKRYIFEVNEPNNKRFNSFQGPNTPSQTVELDSSLSSVLKRDALKTEIGATMLYADSIAEANHNGPAFLDAQGQALKRLGLSNPYNLILDHPYDIDPTASPVSTMTRDFSKMTATIAKYFTGAQFGYGEWGINTKPPAYLASKYPSLSVVFGVSEATKVNYVGSYFKKAQEEGAVMVNLFDINDSGGGNLPSAGDIRIDQSKKDSWQPDANLIKNITGE